VGKQLHHSGEEDVVVLMNFRNIRIENFAIFWTSDLFEIEL
jgi:hypothetical protein